MLECVPNVSEGRSATTIAALAAACGRSLLDVHTDHDHNRSVLTLAGPGFRDAETAVAALARAVATRLDLTDHEGVHPRMGVLDVVPFCALDEDHEVAASAAIGFAEWAVAELALPVFLYDDADPLRRSLPELRAEAFVKRAPDLGPLAPHPTLGAVAVGARPPLVALNCWLDTNDVIVARDIARRVRERDGGLAGVRALGLLLESEDVVQVSMNLVDLPVTGVEAAASEVRRLAAKDDWEITRVEVVGLAPAAEASRWSEAFRAWSKLGDGLTIEARLARAAREAGDDLG
ncbi:MAG: glutamate formiminotransferase [Acidimicrobiia bacterium]|nr:glutamate formiminotransferase [Acidimicrobiia bacterium]